jgi:chaperonin GroES
MAKKTAKEFLQSDNIASEFEDVELDKIGQQLVEWFDEDDDSRRDWLNKSEQYLKLATQVMEKKSFPWQDAANVKYPLLTVAAMQFNARAYPALVPGPNLVSGLVIGVDPDGQKRQTSDRIGKHMSYQLLFEMEDWEEDMDKLTFTLPIVGCMFKKTYHDPLKKINHSHLIQPKDFVIDYYAKSIDNADRKFHVIYKNDNQVLERVRRGLFLDVELGQPVSLSEDKKPVTGKPTEPKVSPATPYKFIEAHCWWDLDGDKYREPYVITVSYETKKVVRIVPRYDEKGITFNDKGEIVRIEPIEYFTKFGFIPNPDGSIYDLGFGLLLGGLNETVNTLTNQLLDSGTLNNLQAGFLGRGIRIKGGNTRFQPGEWKPVDFTGEDIKKHIFPLPTKEPSDVLLKLLELLVSSTKEISSIADIMVGKMPGQNTPATTTMQTVEQGLKVFTAIHKRVYRALTKEYAKLYALNGKYMDDKVFFTINQPQGTSAEEVYRSDYDKNIAVKPSSDPNVVSISQKLNKVQAMGALLQLGTINTQLYTKQYLEAIEAENIEALMQVQPQPNPEQQKMQLEMQQKAQEAQIEQGHQQALVAMKSRESEMKLRGQAQKLMLDEKAAQLKMMSAARQAQVDTQASQVSHAQTIHNDQQAHGQKLQHNEQMAKAKAKAAAHKPKPKGA